MTKSFYTFGVAQLWAAGFSVSNLSNALFSPNYPEKEKARLLTPRKILIATFGSLGDLHPFVALAHALAREGFAPVIATSAAYAEFIKGEGISFAPIRPDADDLTARLGMDMGEIARKMSEDDKFLFDSLIFPHLRETYDDLLLASEGAVAVVSHSLAFAARVAAEKRGLPLATVLLSPMMLYSAYDPPLGSRMPLRSAPAWPIEIVYNRLLLWSLSHAIALWAEPLRRLRRDVGLDPRYGLDLLLGVKSSDAVIGLFSPMLAPPQPDHGRRTFIAGHTFHDRYLEGGRLPSELAAFLAAGEAPFVFTLGSFVVRARCDFYRDCIAAARRLGRRAVLLAHEDDVAELAAELGADVHISSYAPHSLVFPRARAVVHHGGIGTTGQALRAGRPQLVTPFLGDQFDNAERLQRLGVARVLDGKTATAQALYDELAAFDKSYEARALAVAEEVRREEGAGMAALRIAALIAQHQLAREGALV
ncbi:glycosyltransferase [Methylocystis sp. MJC1]|uniref:glycosyltransferase n=1 Tax=Methylocystis sp. MJC1 TaxID=2654282 RepID=UPI0013ED2F16|nr:glycosyltransferase [Methylocystis sp. MJC1]MBU6527317.1 glycosyltransferase family 1 protein [Methylocystis sp. MJC1]UZX10268.1 glycosyltransferase [Methylocystis sp. MJC1]